MFDSMSSLIPYHRSPFDLRGSFGENLMRNFTQMAMTMQNFYRQNACDQRYLRRTRRKKLNLWKKKLDTMPLPMYTAMPLTTANTYMPPLGGYQYEQEIRYVPYPIRPITNDDPFGLSQNLLVPALSGITTRGNALTQLPPKIRIIFVPTEPKRLCLPPVMSQPVHTGPLTMPPFLFNRVSSFMNCFTLPPPLPQINSLPLTPAVQQMVLQRYNHPSTVFMSMPSLPGFPSYNQLPMPISALQSYPPASTSYPNLPMAQVSPVPPTPQQPCPCRACPPAPPALNIPVKDYSWVQHCSACGGVTKPSAEPNTRPAGGRVTPLLTHSRRSPRLSPISSFDVDRYPHVNPSAKDRPWLHKLPPLPPGAVVISDEIISRQENFVAPQISQTRAHEHSEYRERSIRRSKAQLFSSPPSNPPIEVQSEHQSSPCSTCSSSNEVVELEPIVQESPPKKHNFARQQLSTSAKKLNLRYNFLPQDIASVYRKNSYAKSTSGDSLSSSESIRSKKRRSLLIKEYNRQRPPPAPHRLNSIVEESLRSFSSCSFQSNTSKKKSLVIREYSMKSPSITSRISNDSELFIVVKESTDSVSMVSLLKAEKNNIVVQETISVKSEIL